MKNAEKSLKEEVSLVIIFSVFILFSMSQWNRPAIEDEAIISRLALHWFKYGPKLDELYHTPSQLDLLGLWQKLFGSARENLAILRSFGTVCGLLTAGIFFATLKNFRIPKNTRLGLLALLLFSPYFIQGSLLIDVDNTIHTVLLLLFGIAVEFSYRSEKRTFWSAFAALSFALAMMTKELTPMIGIALWIGFPFLRFLFLRDLKRLRYEILNSMLWSIVSILLFVGMMAGWAKTHSMEFAVPFRLTFSRAGGGYLQWPWRRLGSFSRFFFVTYVPLLWIVPPVGVLLLERFSHRRKGSSKTRVDPSFILIFGLSISAAYAWITQLSFYFPKYGVPALPLLILGLAVQFRNEDGEETKEGTGFSSFPLFMGGLLGFLPFFVHGLDPFLIIDSRRELTKEILGLHGAAILLPFFFALFFAFRRKSVIPYALALFVAFGVHQVLAPYETRYNYGEKGFAETVSTVRRLAEARHVVFTPEIDLQWAMKATAAVVFEDSDGTIRSDKRQTESVIGDYTVRNDQRVWAGRLYGDRALNRPSYQPFLDGLNCHLEIPKNDPRFSVFWKSVDCSVSQ